MPLEKPSQGSRAQSERPNKSSKSGVMDSAAGGIGCGDRSPRLEVIVRRSAVHVRR